MSGQAIAHPSPRATVLVMPTLAEARAFRVCLDGRPLGTMADAVPALLRATARHSELLFEVYRTPRHWQRWQAARLVMRDRGVED